MALQLSLPTLNKDIDAETNPSEIQRWLTNLPMLNVAETSHQIFKALSALNCRALENKPRLKLLELYRQPVYNLCREMQKQYLGQDLPLAEKSKIIADRVKQFQVEMGYGYKRIVMGISEKDKLSGGEKKELALCTQRAIRYLTEVLTKSYELYAPPSEGVWQEIHQLYRYAEIEGVTDIPVDDPINTAADHSSVSHVYKQALLLDFADPYHLPPRMLDKIYYYLDVYAPLAQLTIAIESLRPDCQFLINLSVDSAGVADIENKAIATEAPYRLLTTTELARVIHQQIAALQKDLPLQEDGLKKDFYSNQGLDMLTRVLTCWGVNPKRLFNRNPKQDSQFEVIVGIDAINYFVNNGTKFMLSTAEVGPQPLRTDLAGQESRAIQVEVDKKIPSPWNLLDESAGGFSLGKPDVRTERIRVGDVIATRTAGKESTWNIAMVRWVRSSGSNDIEIGAQRLAPSATPLAIMATDEEEGGNFTPALLLPEIKPLKQAQTLITHSGLFKPDRVLILDSGFRTQQVRATQLTNATGSFEQFQFSLLDS